MEPWQITLCAVMLTGAYFGKNYLNYKNEKQKIENDKLRIQTELERKKLTIV